MNTPTILAPGPISSIEAISDVNLYRHVGNTIHSTSMDDHPGILIQGARNLSRLNNEAAEIIELRTLASVAVNNRLISLADRLDLVDEVQDRSSALLLDRGTNPMQKPMLRALEGDTIVKIELLEGVWPNEEWCANRQDSNIKDIKMLTGKTQGSGLEAGKGILSELMIQSMYMHLFLGGSRRLPMRANLRQDMGRNGAFDIALLTNEYREVNSPAVKIQVKASYGHGSGYNDDIAVICPEDLGVTKKRGGPMSLVALASAFMYWDLSGSNSSPVVRTASSNLLAVEAAAVGSGNVAKIQPVSIAA